MIPYISYMQCVCLGSGGSAGRVAPGGLVLIHHESLGKQWGVLHAHAQELCPASASLGMLQPRAELGSLPSLLSPGHSLRHQGSRALHNLPAVAAQHSALQGLRLRISAVQKLNVPHCSGDLGGYRQHICVQKSGSAVSILHRAGGSQPWVTNSVPSFVPDRSLFPSATGGSGDF